MYIGVYMCTRVRVEVCDQYGAFAKKGNAFLSVLRHRGEILVEVKRGRLGRPSTSRTTTARTQQNQMSAFAVLQGAEDGDFDRLVQKKKLQLAKESAKREAEAAASRAAFDDLKAKAGQSNWADDDEEDDDFYSLPVRCPHTGTEHVSSSYLFANQDTHLLLRRVALAICMSLCVMLSWSVAFAACANQQTATGTGVEFSNEWSGLAGRRRRRRRRRGRRQERRRGRRGGRGSGAGWCSANRAECCGHVA